MSGNPTKKAITNYYPMLSQSLIVFKINQNKGAEMLNSSLHEITIEELFNYNKQLHSEYISLITFLEIAVSSENLEHSQVKKFSKQYDPIPNEAFIEVNFENSKIETYIHKDFKKFIVGLDGSGKPFNTASDVIQAINESY